MSLTGQQPPVPTGVLDGAEAPPEAAAAALVVVVVGDSRTRTRELSELLSGHSFVVAAEVCTALAAEAAVVEHQPGAVLIDLDADNGGIEAIERIMGTRPHAGGGVRRPRGALAGRARRRSRRRGRRARRAADLAAVRDRAASPPADRQPGPGHHPSPEPAASPRAGRAAGSGGRAEPARRARTEPVDSPMRAVVIGASTGGPPALATILGDLPASLPVPVLVVQHMADGFVEGLATWLNELSPLPVAMAEHGKRLLPGRAYVAPAGLNTVLRPGLRVELRTPPPGQFHVPGVDTAFASTAAVCGARAVGVLLTGMGRDGAEGLRTLHDAGALTIGQDEPTSVVWGMPAAAQALGAVEVELPLGRIAAAIVAAASPRRVRS